MVVIHNKYYQINRIKENEVGGHVARMAKARNTSNVLVRITERQRILGKPRQAWDGNI
jgi:hypothetical protein